MHTLTFNNDWDQEKQEYKHEYWVDNVQKPSTNGILEAIGVQDYSFIPQSDRERYFLRGNYVHLAVALLLRNELAFDTVDPSIEGYVRAGEKFISDTGFKAICVEKPLYHPLWNFCGTPDCCGTFRDGRVVVLDWKTGTVLYHVRWQTAAYAELYAVNEIAFPVERYGVKLCADGRYKMSECWIDPVDLREFYSFCTSYRRQVVRIKDGKCVKAK